MRVLFRGGFDTYSGYGNDAIDLAVFMARAGIDVVPWPTSVMPGLPAEFLALLGKDPGGRYDVEFTFGPPFDLHPWEHCQLAPKAVGYTMWERLPMAKADMAGRGWDMRRQTRWWSEYGHEDEHKRAGKAFDLMLVTCMMNVVALSELDPWMQYQVLPCGIDGDRFPAVPRESGRPMRFCSWGMLAGRKDPLTLIQAWRELKAEVPGFDAELHLKTSCPGLHPKIAEWEPSIRIYERAWTPKEMLGFMHDMDVYVSTSRGEGNNKPAMEMMASGGTVIASDWSGHKNWLHPDVSYPVGGVLRPCDGAPYAQDFRIDKEALKATIQHCWSNPDEVHTKGERAATYIRQSLSWESIVDKLGRTFGELVYG